MKTDDARSLATAALDRLSAALESGHSDAMLRYLETMARFHRYSFGNILLIASQCPHATNVAGFRAWNRFNRFVKRGEKGIVILAPMVVRKKAEVCPFEPTGSFADPKPASFLRFRTVYVFDISQTDGEALPEPPRVGGDPGPALDRLRDQVAVRGITLEYGPAGGAEGVSCGGKIIIRPGLAPGAEFAVLVHELAHELLHRGEDRATLGATIRETEAEAVAFVVCHGMGLETGTASSDYIRAYRGDRDTLAASLDRIQKTAAEILTGIQDQEHPNSVGAKAQLIPA